MEEIWKTVKNFEDYQVSNTGKVRSCKRNKIKEMAQDKRYGYMRITLRKKGKSKHYQVHRLIAETFIDNPLNLKEVNHKNGIKDDNNVENLEWCSRSENEKHCYRNNPELHKTSIVYQYDLQNRFIKEWNSIKEAQETLKINNVSACCRGVRKKAGGYIWKYKREYRNKSV